MWYEPCTFHSIVIISKISSEAHDSERLYARLEAAVVVKRLRDYSLGFVLKSVELKCHYLNLKLTTPLSLSNIGIYKIFDRLTNILLNHNL